MHGYKELDFFGSKWKFSEERIETSMLAREDGLEGSQMSVEFLGWLECDGYEGTHTIGIDRD